MQAQDWQQGERLYRIAAEYAGRGKIVDPIPHLVEVRFSTVGADVWPFRAAGASIDTARIVLDVTPATDAPWVWIGNTLIRHRTAGGADLMPVRDKLVRFTLRSSNRRLGRHELVTGGGDAGGWIPLRSIFGTWGQPFLWPFPVFFKRADVLGIEFVNNSGTNGTFPLWALLGYKLLAQGRA